jgi:acetyl esterase/lipase
MPPTPARSLPPATRPVTLYFHDGGWTVGRACANAAIGEQMIKGASGWRCFVTSGDIPATRPTRR